ncbi:MAG TPA: sigma-70 family RNA polymerase sigma factor [Candidatus Acidoferrum sp.]|jgi:RNA polymerase sigma-70 factor (ECF subfamily)|nr:sigma-70 family RNA polymerase sigma factor [Candidatus Acidoferrum sp.]
MELLERFAAGDVEAFEALFRQHQCEVYGWILRIVRDRATAEDLTIETFWRMYRAHARFDAARGNCTAWLRRIATNAALDHLRRTRREVPLPEDPPDAPKVPAAERSELQRTILSAMNSLSPRLRVAVVLALVEEESYDRIAEALGISVSAVKVRVFRGVRILRKELSRAGVRP